LNVGGRLTDLSTPVVMGILNITPDSCHISIDPDDAQTDERIARCVRQMRDEGACIVDVGGCSTRPDSTPADSDEEWRRIDMALNAIRRTDGSIPLSVDTVRTEIAERAIDKYGAMIVNDISGGCDEMYDMVARRGVPYILTFNEPRHAGQTICQQALLFFAERVQQLRDRGQKDIVLDPGFGFNKTLDENFQLMANLDSLRIFRLPLLVGISHKRMVYETLGTTHQHAANGTTVLNTSALERGASILRVHNVRDAAECIQLWRRLMKVEC
ncbi:MAG: dihydropteroate synthase, partial [Bacteroidaceae bacterium]|nr:dihydropteroate synthase [Bacteroidaceae bacterium]